MKGANVPDECFLPLRCFSGKKSFAVDLRIISLAPTLSPSTEQQPHVLFDGTDPPSCTFPQVGPKH